MLSNYPPTKPLENLWIEPIVDHYDAIIGDLDTAPIIMGHWFGGAFAEILLHRRLGAAGVAIDVAAANGITKLPFARLKSGVSGVEKPVNRHRTVALTLEEFHYAITKTTTLEQTQSIDGSLCHLRPRARPVEGGFANFNPTRRPASIFRPSSSVDLRRFCKRSP